MLQEKKTPEEHKFQALSNLVSVGRTEGNGHGGGGVRGAVTSQRLCFFLGDSAHFPGDG